MGSSCRGTTAASGREAAVNPVFRVCLNHRVAPLYGCCVAVAHQTERSLVLLVSCYELAYSGIYPTTSGAKVPSNDTAATAARPNSHSQATLVRNMAK